MLQPAQKVRKYVTIQKYTKYLKIPHMGNTRPSRTCVTQEYWFYTMSLSQYHGWCQYHESIAIPWFLVYTMSLCLYQESIPIQWVHDNTSSPCLFNESMSIPVLVNSMHPCLYQKSFPIIWVNVYTMSQEVQNTEINKIQKYKFQ